MRTKRARQVAKYCEQDAAELRNALARAELRADEAERGMEALRQVAVRIQEDTRWNIERVQSTAHATAADADVRSADGLSVVSK